MNRVDASGDYYEVVAMPDSQVGATTADVSGKGAASALLAANLQAAVRVQFPEKTDLLDMVGKINRLVHQNTDTSRFITAILAIFDRNNNKLSYVSKIPTPHHRIC